MMKSNKYKLSLIILLASIVSGCAIDQGSQRVAPIVAPPVSVKPSAADTLMQSLRELQGLSVSALAAEKEVAREAFERDPVQFRRLRYLLALHVQPASALDDERLLVVVEPMLNTTTDDNDLSIKTFVLQMREVASSRKKLRDEITATRNRAAASASASAANNKREDREPEIRALRQRIEELEKQIMAMKSIDRSVTRR